MIQHQSYATYFVVTCDKCGRLDLVSTAQTATQAKRIATAFLSWEMDTPLGDLCRRCAWESDDGSLDEGRAGALDDAENTGERESPQRERQKDTVYIRDELVLEAQPQGESPHILLRREGEPGSVRVHLNEVRYLADALCSMATRVAGRVVGYEESGDD